MEDLSLEFLLTQTNAALVIIDVQNDFCCPKDADKDDPYISTVAKMMERLTSLVDAARLKGAPVIFVQNIEDESTDSFAWLSRPDVKKDSTRNEGVCRRGTWGTELYQFKPTETDYVVEKHRFSAFVDTKLQDLLGELKIDTLIFTGVATNICVETSARHAVMLDYHVIMAEDACATWDAECHESTKKNISLWFGKVVTVDEITDIWENTK